MAVRRSPSSKTQAVPNADTRVLVLLGSEQMLRKELLGRLSETMQQAHGQVDVLRFDGQRCELSEVFDELRSYGLMQQYKIVVVDQADTFVTTHRQALERYVANPVDHGTLVLQCGRWYKSKLDKGIAKVGCICKCEPLSPVMLKTRLMADAKNKHGCQLTADAALMLIGRVGCDLMLLGNELAKLALMVERGSAIGCELIEQVVSQGSDEEAWEIAQVLLQALARGHGGDRGDRGDRDQRSRLYGGAVEKIHELVALSKQPDVLVAYFLADMVRKLHLGLMMKQQGASERELASKLKLWGGRQALFMSALAHLSAVDSEQLFDQIIGLDVRSKTGFGNPLRNIEGFCAMIDNRS